ncbi:Protein of unknown function [Sulfitobacter brevis]|uniref:DUF3429 domain-containing protein n=1 Tax=Sulfitobacter brevis TaxID=74348 RepID=A0A1I2DIH0_9RHOB|nr:Protein of unknown function [Sulfitobacter brevis]
MAVNRIPPAALLLGLAGLVPFLFGALVSLDWVNTSLDAAVHGRLLLVRYGVIILSFMSGALWSFATKAQGRQAAICYALSTVPALWVFLNPGSDADTALINLMIGFAGVLILDFAFHRWELTPPWWLTLRIQLTAIVLICLAVGLWA